MELRMETNIITVIVTMRNYPSHRTYFANTHYNRLHSVLPRVRPLNECARLSIQSRVTWFKFANNINRVEPKLVDESFRVA